MKIYKCVFGVEYNSTFITHTKSEDEEEKEWKQQ